MKKLACILLAVLISGVTFANRGGRRYVASLDNSQVVKARKDARRSLRAFASGSRYGNVTHGHGLHLFRRRGGSSHPDGLGL